MTKEGRWQNGYGRELSDEEDQWLLHAAPLKRISGDLAPGTDGPARRRGMPAGKIAEVTFTSPDGSATYCTTSTPMASTRCIPATAAAPPTFTLPQRRQINQLALSRPQDHDLPFAAWSLLSVRLLARPEPALIAVVGCGVIGETHVRMLAATLPSARFVVYDLDGTRQEALAASTLVAHVSLDDVLPDVVRLADLVVVDDWRLVRGDSRRLLGRMYRSGELPGPQGDGRGAGSSSARRVDATLADMATGRGGVGPGPGS